MERGVSIAVGAGVLALAGLLVWRANATSTRGVNPTVFVSDAAPTTAVGPDAAATTTSAAGVLGVDASASAPLLLEGAAGTRLPDGSPVPPSLPEKAPRFVRFGVVLVHYQGAQGAPQNARSKKDALDAATKLATDAKTDFKAAVVRGDTGSIEDVGRVPRGVLEPAPEYVLFTMTAGTVSEPIDTPRGYWIVKRID